MSKKLILGTVQFGLDYGINNIQGIPSKKTIKEILDYAYFNGIRFLDTAEAYGNSHEKIGEYIKQSNNKFKIITKYCKSRIDLPSDIINRVKYNIRLLNTDTLYCYMFHSFNDYSIFYKLFAKDLLSLKENGLIKKIGVSLHSNEEIIQVLKNSDIDVIQLPFNLLDNSNQRKEILLTAKNKGIEIHTRSVFLQGIFFKDPDDIKGNLVKIKKYLNQLTSIASKNHINDLAINYAHSKQYIDYVLIGVDSITHLRQNIDSINNSKTTKLFSEVDKINVLNKLLLNPVNWKQ